MATTQLSATEEQVAEASAEENPAAEDAGKGFWGALRFRAQLIFSNYMGLQGQLGLYGNSDEFGDP